MIKLQNVSKTYENGTLAVDDVNFELPEKGMVAIVGTSGCGKSTILNLMSHNDIVSSGEILYNDKNANEFDGGSLANDFAYVYQDFKLIDNLTAYQNIMIGSELAENGADYEFVLEIAKNLGIVDNLDEKVYALSGGQQQRVAIARAIARKPKVIFADEPTGNLDEENSINVCNILRKLANDILVVVVSHEQEIADWADRVITMLDGKILSDEAGKAMPEKQLERDENSLSDSEVAELIRQKNQKGKKISEFFSFKNKPKTAKKKKGLSAKSSVGLSLALLNKDIAKKVCLTIVMIILISVMVLSVSMSFATSEKTLANAINNLNGDKKLFEVDYVVGKDDYKMDDHNLSQIDGILERNNLDFYEIGTGEVIANGWGNLQTNNANLSAYFVDMELKNQERALFVDDPKSLGIEILIGRTATKNNEIVISKTYYDYLLHCKNFYVEINEIEYELSFDESNILDSVISPFGVKICGVFDDRNSVDNSLKDKQWDKLSVAEQTEIKTMVNLEHRTNPLINLVIKCKSAQQDWKQFAGVNSDLKIAVEDCFGYQNAEYYFEYMPYSDCTKRYFNFDLGINPKDLEQNSIIVDKNTLAKLNEYLISNHFDEVFEGDKISLSVVGMTKLEPMGYYYPNKVYKIQEFTIAKVLDDMGTANGKILFSERVFDKLTGYGKLSTERMICADKVTAKQLTALNKDYKRHFELKFQAWSDSYLSYSIAGCPMTRVSDYDFIGICQKYVSIPLMIVAILLTVAMIVLFYFDFVKTKANELLILKSLGAKTKDFLGIYGIFSLALIIVQLIFGLAFGSLLIYIVNILASNISGYMSVFSVFYLDAAAWIFSVCAIAVINVISLAISMAGINNKNLRKSFQKLKK